jgi:hypothetical protein
VPINLGSSEAVSINQLVDIVEDIAGIKLNRRYDLDAPKGVNGRNSDNTLIQKYLGWEPSIPLRTGWKRPTPGFLSNISYGAGARQGSFARLISFLKGEGGSWIEYQAHDHARVAQARAEGFAQSQAIFNSG